MNPFVLLIEDDPRIRRFLRASLPTQGYELLEAGTGQEGLSLAARGVERTPLYNWGRYRWFEGLIPVFYLYERTGEGWLLDLAGRLREQGFDYPGFYRGEDETHPTPRRGLWTWGKHVVNTGMAVKAGALDWRLTGLEEDRPEVQVRIDRQKAALDTLKRLEPQGCSVEVLQEEVARVASHELAWAKASQASSTASKNSAPLP